MGGESKVLGVMLDAVDRGILCNADADRLLRASCELVGARGLVLSRSGDNGWRRSLGDSGWTAPPEEPPIAPRRGPPYALWRKAPTAAETAWSTASTVLRSIDGPVRLTFHAGPRGGEAGDAELRVVAQTFERALQSPTSLAAFRGEQPGTRAEVIEQLPHGLIVGQSVQLNESALALLRDTLGNLAGRSVQRLQRALVHAAGCSAGTAVPFVGDLRVDFVRTDEGMLAVFRRAHVPTLNGHWEAPAEQMLSPRQRQVAALVMRGENLNGIAESLEVQAETARGYLKDVYRRLGVRDRGSLTAILRF